MNTVEPTRRFARSILFLALPLLLTVILVFAKTSSRYARVISINSDGTDVLYYANGFDQESRYQLVRDHNDRMLEVDLPKPPKNQNALEYEAGSIEISRHSIEISTKHATQLPSCESRSILDFGVGISGF